MEGACSTYDGEKRFMQGFGGETKRKTPLERPRYRWEDIKMDLQVVGWGMDWIDVAQEGQIFVNTLMNLRVP